MGGDPTRTSTWRLVNAWQPGGRDSEHRFERLVADFWVGGVFSPGVTAQNGAGRQYSTPEQGSILRLRKRPLSEWPTYTANLCPIPCSGAAALFDIAKYHSAR